ncbi:hypothetical protein [Thermodesulfovibrio thiophilus]|uniref:hypothetical protein n=1 Tax=Thermodesulfovibrio thiophilus TaxID=340095 RepID=UPI00181AE120|nr:hypothetical protein [Thermodesulfovibrio thiophilus]HHW20699.1 hypothetical protein [Thermodesulfovibrio thiophilus]
MKKNLADIIESLFENKSTGFLSIVLNSEKNLIKFYFKNGDIYHISFGFKKGAQCINELLSKEPQQCNFIPMITVDMTSDDIPSTEKIIEMLRDMNKFINITEAMSPSADFGKVKEGLKIALIKQIGPIGGKLIEKTIQEKWMPSSPPSKEDFLKLIDMLKDEIEDSSGRREFLIEANKLLEVYR